MKKIIMYLLSLFLFMGLMACSNKTDSFVELKKDVKFELLDALKVENEESNSIYYYFLADIKNDSSKIYNMSDLSYKFTDNNDSDINAIDSDKMTPASDIQPGESTYLYGYIGFPNNDQKDIGLTFPKINQFISFNSIKLRTASNKQINKAKGNKFILFEDKYLKIYIDGSNIQSDFKNESTELSNLKITYENKTEESIVIPYLRPTATLNGLYLENYNGKGDFSKMNLEEIKKLDFSNHGMAPKTEDITADATGYALYFLEGKQKLTCNIGFIFEKAIPDYSKKENNFYQINLTSASFGTTVPYKVPVQ